MIVGAMLLRNESGRWLGQVLTEMCKVCDAFAILDDASTDDTIEICRSCIGQYKKPLHICQMPESLWASNELKLRKKLWDMAKDLIPQGDWILNLDADEIPLNIEKIKDIMCTYGNIINGIGFRLYDMWDDEQYRDDAYWSAHMRWWYMAARYDPHKEYAWRETSLHCGRFPKNVLSRVHNDNDLKIKHMGWSRQSDRLLKYERYMKADPEGKHGILKQYESILDEKPQLEKFR